MSSDEINIIHIFNSALNLVDNGPVDFDSRSTYNGFYEPFQYHSRLIYNHGDVRFEFTRRYGVPKGWIAEDLDYTTVYPEGYNLSRKRLQEYLCNLLNVDFAKLFLDIQTCCRQYIADIGQDNYSPEELCSITKTFIFNVGNMFATQNPYFFENAFSLIRDELTAILHKEFFYDITKATKERSVTAEDINEFIYIVGKRLTPFFVASELIQFRSHDENYVSEAIEIYMRQLRSFLIKNVVSCPFANTYKLDSPFNEIAEAMTFLEKSCKFLFEYQDRLDTVTAFGKMLLCVELFSPSDRFKTNFFEFFWQRNSSENLFCRDLNIAIARARNKINNDQSCDFNEILSYLSKGSDSNPETRTLIASSFSSLVFIALMEMISSGDADGDPNESKIHKGKFIIQCRNCGRYFLQSRSNKIYCDQIAPGSTEPCSKIGAKKVSDQKQNASIEIYKKTLKRFDSKIYRAKKQDNDKLAVLLNRKKMDWLKQINELRSQMESGLISEDEYIKKLNEKYYGFFPKSR